MNDGKNDQPALPENRETPNAQALRDHFAAAALQGMLANVGPSSHCPERLAYLAYEFADAVIHERISRLGK